MKFISLFFLLFIAGCGGGKSPQENVIAFVAHLEGGTGLLAMHGHDGLVLAVEEHNAKGDSIYSYRLINLERNPEHVMQVFEELANEGIRVAIGPIESSMGEAVIAAATAHNILVISPTVGSDQFSGRDDIFLRLNQDVSSIAESVGEHLVEDINVERLSLVLDKPNFAYTDTYATYLRDKARALGLETILTHHYSETDGVALNVIAEKIAGEQADVVYVLLNSLHTAVLSQLLYQNGYRGLIYASEWAFESELIQFGGQAADQIKVVLPVNPFSMTPSYLEFRRNYEERFGEEPNMSAARSYEAANILISNLDSMEEEGYRSEDLKRNILRKSPYEGVYADIEFDRFGDTNGGAFLVEVRDGQFHPVGDL